ncbi:arginine / lysine / ornithine decarboxylase [Proteiniborus sp.]|uniref:aminotransferase class I/II-fold pyridoxal phosphate-dependent enzyme n=1 Tax=Proteiniborus sp. TaxID=2079015 RepID=UPI003322E5AA
MKTPIINGLKKYALENNKRFHMPGHKGKELLRFLGELIPEIDVTEVEGTDNLHNPSTIIYESQRLAAETFGAIETFYSVNGTTGGLHAAITATVRPGGKALIQRDCHRAVYNALILGKITPKYIYPKYSEENNIVTTLGPEEIDKELSLDSDIDAVIITYPTYYGICSDIKNIAEVVHKHRRVLIVDEAHGSHLKFNNRLPTSALDAGADIVIQSTHKTLPAFTQSSMIHVGSHRVDIEKLKSMISIFQTTSPSYILMSSIDFAIDYMRNHGKDKLEILLNNIEKWTTYMKQIEKVNILDKGSLDSQIFDFDNTKILMKIDGLTGKSMENILREKYKIQLEMSDYYYGLALTSVLDEDEELERLAYAVEDISKKHFYVDRNKNNIDIRKIKPDINISLYDAFHSEKTEIQFTKSSGEISGDFIIPYPPGIPILCPGEVISDDIISYIETLKKNNIQILGFLDYNREKIKIVKKQNIRA